MIKRFIVGILTGCLILCLAVPAFAEEKNIPSDAIGIEDIEFEINEEDVDENGHFEFEICEEGIATSKGVITDENSEGSGVVKSKLPSIVVEGFAKKGSWSGSILELNIGCKATGGNIKTYKGTCTIYNSTGLKKVTSKDYTMTYNAGTKYLVRQYSFRVGNRKSCKVKLTNQIAIDIYGRSCSLYPVHSGLITK